ncbi:MAG: hypothetical protein Q8O41_10605 [Candidatus Methanoperedens sp.]|nr:hypothetical protein [Candidatus Methanoperedens sp.]
MRAVPSPRTNDTALVIAFATKPPPFITPLRANAPLLDLPSLPGRAVTAAWCSRKKNQPDDVPCAFPVKALHMLMSQVIGLQCSIGIYEALEINKTKIL